MIGQVLSHYRVLAKLGEGGMGVVYKAQDTRLDRIVAIKMLPPGAVSSPERRRRFIHEARAASALNHPNIVTIHDIGSADGADFIVMEFVAGKTLDKLIGRNGLLIRDVLEYGIQIAAALTAAHAAGIVHRDLKPSNIMATETRLVKVVDFGLAKLTEPSVPGEDEVTRTLDPHASGGVILGTAAYMSPEQAEGKPVDARSDIFSFASVLYELITGRRAFRGSTTASTLAAIIREEPEPPGHFRTDAPRELEQLIIRCLHKDPTRRVQHMDDVKLVLEELKQAAGSPRAAGKQSATQPKRRKRRFALLSAAAVLIVAGAAVWRPFRHAAVVPSMTRIPLTSYTGSEQNPTFSPDGTQIAFSWNGENRGNYNIYVKLVDGGAPVRVTTSSSDDTGPAWSPDGRFIAFLRDSAVYIVSPLGGPERHVVGDANLPVVGNIGWLPGSDGLVISALVGGRRPASLFRVRLDTEERRKLTSPPEGLAGDFYAAATPDGQWIAFVRYSVSPSSTIQMIPAAGGQARAVTTETALILGLSWMPGGKELIFSSNTGGAQSLWRIRAVYGASAAPVVVPAAGGNVWFPVIALLRTGSLRLAYEQHIADANIWTMEVAEAGARGRSPRSVIASTRMDYSPQLSLDGSRIAFESDRSGYREIWMCDHDGANSVQLTSLKSLRSGTPRWSPDGSRIAFDSLAAGNNDIWIIAANGGPPRRLTIENSNDARPSWSRDGQWIYFRSDRTGAQQIWKMPAAGGAAVQVTRQGGFEAFESPDSSVVYYVQSPDHPGLWSIPVGGGPETAFVPDVRAGYWALCDAGVYYVVPSGSSAANSINFFAFAARQSRPVGIIQKSIQWNTPGLAVSRDCRRILWSQVDSVESDLMLLENFR